MQLDDVKNLLGISINQDQTAIYEARLAAAIDQAQTYCNNPFKDLEGKLAIPGGAKMGIALMVKALGEQQNVASQSLGDMSKSFFQNGTYAAAIPYLQPYKIKKARFY
jgi:hypothetical protein